MTTTARSFQRVGQGYICCPHRTSGPDLAIVGIEAQTIHSTSVRFVIAKLGNRIQDHEIGNGTWDRDSGN